MAFVSFIFHAQVALVVMPFALMTAEGLTAFLAAHFLVNRSTVEWITILKWQSL